MTTQGSQGRAPTAQNYDGLDEAKSLASWETNNRQTLPHGRIQGEILLSDETEVSLPVGHPFPQEKQAPPSPEPQLPRDVQSKVASRNSDFQEVWEGIMEGVGLTEMPHKQTAVLMISWDDGLDDLDTAAEVNALSDVFTEKFRYTVVKERLTAEKKPAHQLSKHLADFILNFDSESTLLIIYYAGMIFYFSSSSRDDSLLLGHGTPGKPGELHFTG
jgi:hypothetical protein